MKKEDLMKLGLDEAIAAKAADASAEELKGYIPKARFDEVNGENKTLKASLTERDGQLESLKKSTGDAEALQAQIAQLQADNKAKDEAHAAEVKALRVAAAVDTALTAARAKNLKAAKALLDLEKAELSEDGTVKGLQEQLGSLAKSDAYLFEPASKKPAIKGAAPGETSVEEADGRADPASMGYDQFLAQYKQT